MNKPTQDRLERMEENLAHLIRANEDLSVMVARHEAEIERLSRRVGLLMEREAEAGTIPLADQRPPHW